VVRAHISSYIVESLNLSISYTVSREVNAAGILLIKSPVCLGTFANNEINCQVWEAGQATSAAPKYFPPAEIGVIAGGQRRFEDGGLGYNNPILTYGLYQKDFLTLNGAFGECYVSIGTGKPEPPQPGNPSVRAGWFRLNSPLFLVAAANLQAIATDSEDTHRTFELMIGERVRERRQLTHNPLPLSYHRFNCGGGLADIPLDSAQRIDEIIALTRRYMLTPRFLQKLDRCINALSALTP